ncbi:MAG: hypothetical protein FWE61_11875 [Micrococcales bacterium]|nr:hypothetical protein [Micrococcales bacterium]
MVAVAVDRALRARAALADAEARTGARRVLLVAGDHHTPPSTLVTDERPPLPVPPPLAPLMPEGLRRGAVTTVLGPTWLVLGMLAHAMADGAWAAVVGHPDLGLLAAARAGVPLDRLGLVPTPGDRTAQVLGALADGMGVVLVGPRAALPEADARRITARVRDRGTAVITTVAWPGAHVVLAASPTRWSGVGTGTGRVRSGQTTVVRDRRTTALVDLPLPTPGPVEHCQPRLRRAG